MQLCMAGGTNPCLGGYVEAFPSLGVSAKISKCEKKMQWLCTSPSSGRSSRWETQFLARKLQSCRNPKERIQQIWLRALPMDQNIPGYFTLQRSHQNLGDKNSATFWGPNPIKLLISLWACLRMRCTATKSLFSLDFQGWRDICGEEKFATHCCCFGVWFLWSHFVQWLKDTNTKTKFQAVKWDFQIMHYSWREEK